MMEHHQPRSSSSQPPHRNRQQQNQHRHRQQRNLQQQNQRLHGHSQYYLHYRQHQPWIHLNPHSYLLEMDYRYHYFSTQTSNYLVHRTMQYEDNQSYSSGNGLQFQVDLSSRILFRFSVENDQQDHQERNMAAQQLSSVQQQHPRDISNQEPVTSFSYNVNRPQFYEDEYDYYQGIYPSWAAMFDNGDLMQLFDNEGVQSHFPDATPDELDSFLSTIFSTASEEDLNPFFEELGIGNDQKLSEESILQNLKTRTIEDEDLEEICVVCQNEYEKGEILATLECGHEYHAECITRWLLEKNLCPVCKRPPIQQQETERV